MITRKQYMDNNHPSTHQEYYGQFVNDGVKNTVIKHMTMKYLKANYKSLPGDSRLFPGNLQKWDRIPLSSYTASQMREAGDVLTLSGSVCIAKEAARQIIEGAE